MSYIPPRNTDDRAIDAETVIYRMNEAGRTLIALSACGTRPAGFGSGWPDTVLEAVEAYGYTAAMIRPPVPSAKDITRMDEAFLWIGKVPEDRKRHKRIVLMRCLVHPVNDRHLWSWRQIGNAFGWSHTAVQQWHAQAIDWIVSGLNQEKCVEVKKSVYTVSTSSICRR